MGFQAPHLGTIAANAFVCPCPVPCGTFRLSIPKLCMMKIDKPWTVISHILLIAVVGIVFTLPAFITGFISGHNAITHLLWSKYFAAQLWAGDLYPRWLMGMNAGLGSPAFFFYFPLPYYLTSLFYLPQVTAAPFGWIQLGLSSAAALVLSGLSMYLWLGTIVNRNSAVMAAILYMLMPYHLLIDLYYRFAFTEFWAFVWMPLALYFSRGIVCNQQNAAIGFAVSYALLITSHLPTTLIFSFVPILFLLLTTERKNRIKAVSKLISGMALGIGLSGIYLIPAMTTQANVSLNKMAEGFFNYKSNFLFTSIAIRPPESGSYLVFLSFTSLLSFLLLILLFSLINGKISRHAKIEKYFWLCTGIFATFMMLDMSGFVWDMLPALQRIQFPYRFNSLLILSTTVLLALAINHARWPLSPFGRIALVLASSLVLSQAVITAVTVYKRATGHWDQEALRTISNELRYTPEVPEYRPAWAKEAKAESLDILNCNDNHCRVRFSDGQGDATVLLWRAGRIILQTHTNAPAVMTVAQLYYPGWSARLADGPTRPIEVYPSAGEGLIRMEVPEGTHQLVLELKAGLAEHLGQAASLVSSLLLVALLARSAGRKRLLTHPGADPSP